jgi:hypothetical protein
MGLRDAVAKRKAERQNGAGDKPRSIAALRAAKQQQQKDARHGGLGALREQRKQRMKLSNRLDFTVEGIRYHDARILNRDGRAWGEVSISTGDFTFVFHNRFGSWMHDLDQNGRMAEPAAIARKMGTSASQLEVCQALTERWYKQLKAEGIPTPEERIREREEQARKSRRGGRKNVDNDD